MKIEGGFDVPAARETVYRYVTDAGLVTQCVPGCESIEKISPTEYRATIAVGIGGIQARFNLSVQIVREEAPALVLSQTRGEEGSRSSMLAADSEVRLEALTPDSTRLYWSSDVSVTGRLGRFALGVMKKKLEALGSEFASRFCTRIRAEVQR
jgi:uncharacterized protein